MTYQPYIEDTRPDRVRIRFSATEIRHLIMGVAFLTVAFTLVQNSGVSGFTIQDAGRRFMAPPTLYLKSFFAVSSGFVLHELGHKIVAQRYGHWAEFRGDFRSLVISLAFAAGVGFLFATPGAVMIWGRVDPKQNGIISLMGPAINFVIAAIAIPFTFAADTTALFPSTMAVVAFVNAILCVFNLLPIGNLDGRKIWYWNRLVYLGSLLLGIALVVYTVILGLPFRA